MAKNVWAWWQDQLDGRNPETTPGTPHQGYYKGFYWQDDPDNKKKRVKVWRAIAIWEDGSGWRCTVTKGPAPKTPEAIDDLFASVCRDAISYQDYLAARDGGKLPGEIPDVEVVEIVKGSERDIKSAVSPEAQIGHNNPPADLTPDQAMVVELATLERQCLAWLETLPDRVPQTKADADLCANYSIKFGQLQKRAETAHAAEKEPWLEGGKAVDAKWKTPVINRADALKKRIKQIGAGWIAMEQRRRDEEARRANEAASVAAEEANRKAREEADRAGEAPPPTVVAQVVEAEKVKIGTAGRAVSARKRTVYIIEDFPAACAFFATMENPPPDLIDTVRKLVNRVGSLGTVVPGVRSEEQQGVA